MAKRKNGLSEGKQNIVSALLQEYDIKLAEDIQDTLKDLLGGTIKGMMETELDEHLGYEPHELNKTSNARNGHKKKSVQSKHAEVAIQVLHCT